MGFAITIWRYSDNEMTYFVQETKSLKNKTTLVELKSWPEFVKLFYKIFPVGRRLDRQKGERYVRLEIQIPKTKNRR